MNFVTAQRYVDMLEDHVGAFKVGLELFLRAQSLPLTKKPIVLDLKLHDIPETVAGAVKAGGDLGVKYMTMHVQQRETLEKAVKAAEPFGIKLLGVTVLTSMTDEDLGDLLQASQCDPTYFEPSERALMLTRFAYLAGLRGFVCSPQEVAALKKAAPDAFFLVPGVRPAGAALGDQKRVGTPGQAVKDGANLLVVGRPIRDAEDPVAAAKTILAEVASVA